MPGLPFPLQADNFEQLVESTKRLFDEIYMDRVGGSLLGDVFQVHSDEILALSLSASGGLEKSGGDLQIKVKSTGGVTTTTDGLAVKLKTLGGLSSDINGLFITDADVGSILSGITDNSFTINTDLNDADIDLILGRTTGGNARLRWNGTIVTLDKNLGLLNTGLNLLDTDGAHYLTIKPGDSLSADRVLTVTIGDAARTLTLSGSPTLDDWFDQTVKTTSGPTFDHLHINNNASVGTLTIAGYLLTLEAASLLNQDLTTDAGPTFDHLHITNNATVGTLTVNTYGLTVEAASLLNQDLTTDAGPTFDHLHITGNATVGTLTVSSFGVTVEAASILNQDLTTDASPSFLTAKLTGLTDGYIPYHVTDASGLANSPVFVSGNNIGIGTPTPRKLLDLLSTSQSQLRLTHTDNAVYADFTVNSAGDLAIDPTSGKIQSSNYVPGLLGFGWRLGEDQAEFQNAIIRGKLSTTVFEKDTVNIVNGILLVSKGDILSADMTAADNSTMTIGGDCTFEVDEILRIKDGYNDEWLQVTNIATAPTYTVTRDLAGSYPANANPVWKKGAAVGSFSTANKGFIELDGSSAYSPVLTVHRRIGTTYSDYTPVLKLGKLDGFIGIPENSYGIAIGDGSSYLKYYASLGLQVKGNIDASTITACTITGTDIIGGTFLTAVSGQRFELNSSGMTMYMAGDVAKWDGTEKWDGTGHWGPNIRAFLYNTGKNVPLYFNAASDYADVHYYDRVADPTGAAEIGDTCVVNGELKICTVDGTPGTFVVVGTQS